MGPVKSTNDNPTETPSVRQYYIQNHPLANPRVYKTMHTQINEQVDREIQEIGKVST